MNILIPMAGEGSRFASAGYTFPKPLIDVDGKPMIQRVVENLSFRNAKYIFLVRREHIEKYDIESTLRLITDNNFEMITVEELTEGAACTALLAKDFIDNGEELLIANSDQIIEYSKENFETMRYHSNLDGIIFTFYATHPKWSFAKLDNKNVMVTEVAEKKPISNVATCGIYYYRSGEQFVWAAEQMIRRNKRVNGEFYIAPTFNELIDANERIVPYFVNKMNGIGTPEDLETYLVEKRR